MKKKLVIMAGAGLAMLLVSAALIGVALAADPTPTPNGSTAPYQTFISKLAKILGIQEQQLTDAVKKVRTEMVDDDLNAGKITPDQANKLKEGIDKGSGWGAPLHGGRGRGGPGGPGFGRGFEPMHGTEMTDVASLLGMKAEDLMAELKTGKTLAQLEYLMAVPSAMQGADYVIATGRPVLCLGGFMGQDKVVSASDLSRMVANGELRYIYWNGNGRGSPAGQPEISNWVQANCTAVPGFDTETRNSGAPDGTAEGRSGAPFQSFGGIQVTLYDCMQASP